MKLPLLNYFDVEALEALAVGPFSYRYHATTHCGPERLTNYRQPKTRFGPGGGWSWTLASDYIEAQPGAPRP